MKNTNALPLIIAIIALSVGVWSIASSSKQVGANKPLETAYDRVTQTGILRCAYAVYPPFLAKDPNTGKLSGIMPEIMADFTKANDIKVEWGPEIGFGEIAETLLSNKADAFCAGMAITPKRGKVIAPSTPLYFASLEAFVRSDDTRFDNHPERINQKDVKIAVNLGDFSEEIAVRIFPEAERAYIGALGGESQLFMDVALKKADLTLSGPSNLSTWNSSNQAMKLRKVVMSRPLMVFPAVIGVEIHEQELLNLLNSTLHSLIDSGLVDKALRTNVGDQYGTAYLPPKPEFE